MRLSLAGATKSYGAQLVLDNVSLAVGPRSRIGLVGPNGVGKSTLLRLLAGLEAPDRGTVASDPQGLLVGYMAQERDVRAGETLLGYLARRTGVAEAEAELERLTEELERDPGRVEAYTAALEHFLALGGADLERRARAVCSELGLGGGPEATADLLWRPLGGLSGGEAGRAALAAILLARFDVFLLDEPTNDLDFAGLERLEGFLASLPGGVVVVSHDRAFLDAVVTRIAELEPGTHQLREWAGGWTDYAAARDHARRKAYDEYERSEARRHEVEGLLRQRQGEARGGAKLSYRRGTHALMTKVRQAERALERVDGADKPFEPWELRLELRAGERPGDLVVALHGAVLERGAFQIGPLDLDVGWRERIAITGANGTGKTTLLQGLLGTLPLASGRRVVGRRTVIGSIEQARTVYRGQAPLLQEFAARSGLASSEARTLLAKFGLGPEHLQRPASSLSPGERTRVQLAELTARQVNLLVLDEPTNHLDLEAVEQLEHALAAYDGSLVVVSHDRRFLETIAPTRVIAV